MWRARCAPSAPAARPTPGRRRPDDRDHDQPRARDRDVRDRAPRRRGRRRGGDDRRSARATTRTGRRTSAEPDGEPTGDPTRRPSRPSRPSRPTTPMGSRRSRDGVTESEEVDYRLPPAKALDRGAPIRARTCATARRPRSALLESLRHFGVEARLLGTVSGPHVSRYELQLAPGHEGLQGRAAARRPRLRARLDGHPHPRADPREEGGRASRCRTSAGASSASATSTASRRRAPRRSLVLARQGRLRGGRAAPTWR